MSNIATQDIATHGGAPATHSSCTLCRGAESLCIEPAGVMKSTKWTYVGDGQGGYNEVPHYSYVGSGAGAYELQQKTEPESYKVRPSCCAVVFLILACVALQQTLFNGSFRFPFQGAEAGANDTAVDPAGAALAAAAAAHAAAVSAGPSTPLPSFAPQASAQPFSQPPAAFPGAAQPQLATPGMLQPWAGQSPQLLRGPTGPLQAQTAPGQAAFGAVGATGPFGIAQPPLPMTMGPPLSTGQAGAMLPPPAAAQAAVCSESWDDCSKTGCCQEGTHTCYHLNAESYTCMDKCDANVFACDKATPSPSTAASKAPAFEWYTYRAVPDNAFQEYGFGNTNTGNAEGVMWYLTNEVVTKYTKGTRCPRKFDISKIMRFKITSRATQELFEEGMNFGARFAFDHGICSGRCFSKNLCTSAKDCEQHYSKYGYVLGCNNFGDGSAFPEYPNGATHGVWYTFPQDGRCDASGANPTGAHTCTWTYVPAGEISLAEYENSSPAPPGQGNCCEGRCSFAYDGDFMDAGASAGHAQSLEDLFLKKYPDMPKLSTPNCDFDQKKWYSPDTWNRTAGLL